MFPKFLVLLVVALFSFPQHATADDLKWFDVGITPWQKGLSTDDINKLYLPTLKAFSSETGLHFRIQPMNSYEEAITKLAEGKIQIGMLSPIPYIRAKKLNPDLELLVTELSWNHDKTKKVDSYRGHILVKKNRGDLTDLNSLKGKSFAFVSESSTSGYTVPMAYFRDQKIDPKSYFSKVQFLGSHPNVTDAITKGQIDAGATWDFNLSQAIVKNGDDYRSVWISDAIPNICIVAHPKMPKPIQDKLRKILLNAPHELLEGLPAAGYVRRDDSFYDSVRKIDVQ